MEIERHRYRATLPADGIVRVAMHGLMTKADIDEYLLDLVPFNTTMRDLHGRARWLVHIQMVQSPVVALYYRQQGLLTMKANDRCAFLVATMLSKLQLVRLTSEEGIGVFTNADAALAWLQESAS